MVGAPVRQSYHLVVDCILSTTPDAAICSELTASHLAGNLEGQDGGEGENQGGAKREDWDGRGRTMQLVRFVSIGY